jgi:pimeloyl-ACP methyl ester carboxylesterase
MAHTASPAEPRRGLLDLDGRRIETAWWGLPPESTPTSAPTSASTSAPTLVLLHEGLGSVSLWRGFPARLAEATGCGVFAYSRFGYGRSDPEPLPWPATYMHREAQAVLPRVLQAAGTGRHILLGHSDGGSIAAVNAGSVPALGLAGLVLFAPHFFVEDEGLASIVAIRAQYEHGDLRSRLARHHAHVDNAFGGWNGAWTDPGFRDWNIMEFVPRIAVPMLLLQGTADAYGSPEQIRAAARAARVPAETVLLDGTGHAPHLERPAETLSAVAPFIRSVL